VVDFARVSMLRDRVAVDFDSIGSLGPVERCILIGQVFKSTIASDAQMRARFMKDGVGTVLRDEAIHRKTVQATDIT
jgi:hypothetical protein